MELERTILATWLFMGQTSVRSEDLTAPHAASRRMARNAPDARPTVRYIDLRRACADSSGSSLVGATRSSVRLKTQGRDHHRLR